MYDVVRNFLLRGRPDRNTLGGNRIGLTTNGRFSILASFS